MGVAVRQSDRRWRDRHRPDQGTLGSWSPPQATRARNALYDYAKGVSRHRSPKRGHLAWDEAVQQMDGRNGGGWRASLVREAPTEFKGSAPQVLRWQKQSHRRALRR